MKMVDDDKEGHDVIQCDRKREKEIYQNLNETIICIFVANIQIIAEPLAR